MMSFSASGLGRKYLPSSRSFGALVLLGLAGLLAACGGGSSSTNTTPPSATLQSIAVTAAAASVTAGSTDQLAAVGTYSDGSTKTLTTTATWSSATTSIATVNPSGLATGVAAGTSVITATSGSVSGTLTLTVTAAKTLTSITITPTPAIVIAGSTTQLVATGTYTDSTTAVLTSGVTWTSSAAASVVTVGAATGLATGVAIGTSTVTAAVGTVTSAAVTLTVKPAEYAFVTNFNENTISAYAVGPGGSLVANGAAVQTGGLQPFVAAADPAGKFLYVGNYNSDTLSTVSEFSIGTNGQLTALATPNIAAGKGPNGITVYTNPSGISWVYVANLGDGTIIQYSIDTTSGQLTNVGTTLSGAAGGGAASITFYTNATATYAYVPNYNINTISVFTVTPATGALSATPTSTTTLPNTGTASTSSTGPVSVAVDKTGTYAYIANLGNSGNSGNITQYSINADGSLTPLSPAIVVSGGNPRWITVNPTSGLLYVPNSDANSVQTFTVGTGGALAASATMALASATNPNYLALDPTGTLLFVADRGGSFNGLQAPWNNTVSQFSVAGTTGALTALTTPSVTSGSTAQSEPTFIAFTTAN